VQWQKSTQ